MTRAVIEGGSRIEQDERTTINGKGEDMPGRSLGDRQNEHAVEADQAQYQANAVGDRVDEFFFDGQ